MVVVGGRGEVVIVVILRVKTRWKIKRYVRGKEGEEAK